MLLSQFVTEDEIERLTAEAQTASTTRSGGRSPVFRKVPANLTVAPAAFKFIVHVRAALCGQFSLKPVTSRQLSGDGDSQRETKAVGNVMKTHFSKLGYAILSRRTLCPLRSGHCCLFIVVAATARRPAMTAMETSAF